MPEDLFHLKAILVKSVTIVKQRLPQTMSRDCNKFTSNLSLRIRKTTIWGSDQVLHKLDCTATENSYKAEISDSRRREIPLNYPCSRNKGADQLCSYCVFVFAYADCLFSGSVAHLVSFLHISLYVIYFHGGFTLLY